MLPPVTVLLAFAAVVLALTITPGVDTVLVLRSAAADGTRRVAGVIAGILTGTLVWGALAAVGVSALVAVSEVAFTALRLAGAAYLVWLGGRLVWRAVRGGGADAEPAAPAARGGFAGGLWQGALTNLLNPKVGVFYVALLPQFIPADAPQLLWGLALAGVHAVLGALWLGLVAGLAHVARRQLACPAVRRGIDGVSGTVIAGFGARLALAP